MTVGLLVSRGRLAVLVPEKVGPGRETLIPVAWRRLSLSIQAEGPPRVRGLGLGAGAGGFGLPTSASGVPGASAVPPS